MFDYQLSKPELAELCAAHRRPRNVREAYRIDAVILLGKGRTAVDPRSGRTTLTHRLLYLFTPAKPIFNP